MSRFNTQRLNAASAVQKELATPNVISREQARLYSQAVRLDWQASGLPTWKPDEAESQLLDAERLIEAARILRDLGHTEEASACFRRAGDLLEWLSRSSASSNHPKVQTVPLALLAGAAFQLAGFPAMARGLLSEKRLPSAAGNMFAAFLRADFDAALRHCLDYWRDRLAMTGPDGAWWQGSHDDDPSAELVSSEVVRCLGLISQSIRTNDQNRLKQALRKLEGLSKFVAHSVSDELWLTLSLTSEVAALFDKASLWIWIGRLRRGVSDDGQELLDRYVRNQFRAGRGLLWPSQQEGIRRLSSGSSFAMCTPTGSGKTTIAELAVLRTLYRQDVDAANGVAPLVLYLVPSRALAAEVEARLSLDIASIDTQITITGIYGGTDWSLTNRWLTATGPTVLVCTVEMAETLLRYVGSLLIRRLRLVIVDEAHQVQFDDSPYGRETLRSAENRSARMEQFAARLFTNAPDCPAVALSAVAGGAEQAIAQWISRDTTSSALGINYRSTRQLVGSLDCFASGGTRIRLELVDGKPLHLIGSTTETYIPTPFTLMPRTTGRLRTDVTPFIRCHSLWAAVQLAKSERTVLISITHSIDDIICDFCDALDLQTWKASGSAFFTPPTDNGTRLGSLRAKLYVDCLDACREYCGANSYESRLLQQGIAVHHGQLPVRVRRLMTDVIRFGAVPITVATSTLTEGVNMPFDVIILPSIVRPQRAGPERVDWVTISTPEFLNLAGRAGRPGAGVEGITLIALAAEPTSKSGTASFKSQEKRIRQDQARFNGLIHSVTHASVSPATASSPLSHLLNILWKTWSQLAGTNDRTAFLNWLEATDPATLPAIANGWSEVADALDSLDMLLVSAVEEAERLRESSLTGADLEAYVRLLWSHTYARFAAQETDWLERIFVTRAIGVIEHVHDDPAKRRLIYQLGLPPRRCTSFLTLAITIESELRGALDFATWTAEKRFEYLVGLGSLLQDDPAFRIRNARNHGKKTGATWQTILRWWLRAPDRTVPDASVVRDWLFVATSDFEFRFGSAVNSTISNIWNRIHGEDHVVPSLEEWRDITGLPWAAFWIRELLSWGTLEPVVAYLMGVSSGSSTITTRREASTFVGRYYKWHAERYPDTNRTDDFFHPLHIAEWYRETFPSLQRTRSESENLAASLKRDFPADGPDSYAVLPCELDGRIAWLDAAGYCLAESDTPSGWHERASNRNDFFLNIRQRSIIAELF